MEKTNKSAIEYMITQAKMPQDQVDGIMKIINKREKLEEFIDFLQANQPTSQNEIQPKAIEIHYKYEN